MAAHDVPFGANEQLGIAEVLQIIGLRGRSGQLLLTGEGGRAFLEFAHGRLVNGDLLPVAPDADLGRLPEELQRLARLADLQRTLVDVLGWPSGWAAFQPHEPLQAPEVAYDVDMLLIDAVRVVDEWQAAAGDLPLPGDCFVWADSPPNLTVTPPLTELQRRVLPLCNGRASLAELARRLHVRDLDLLKATQDLCERHFVRRNETADESPFDSEAEATLNHRAVELQVRTSAIAGFRSRDKQVQGLLGVVVDATNALLSLVRHPDVRHDNANVPMPQALATLQEQYRALELVSLGHAGLECGDLIAAHSALSGQSRDAFYLEAIDGLYGFLLQIAVHLVEDRVSGRIAAERIRSMLGALFLEIETAIHLVKPPATLAPSTGLSALRQEHFHLIA